jgi:hypothetical protein
MLLKFNTILKILIVKKGFLNYVQFYTTSTVRKIQLILYTKPECSLCDKAKEELEEHYNGIFELEQVNILKSKELFRKFKFDIPVFYYNNHFLMQHKIDREKLDDLIKSLK